ncbi:MAG: glycosyltransferase family 39 protein, partial [Candidatus Sumerlaeota bacterium]|nr:glycosyltransferase family 39 protein [Candidatus Sumerlaeota bacterium]
MTNTSPKVFRPIHLLPVLIFLCLALYKTVTTSLWLDEIMALDFCDGDIKEMMGNLQRDVHAPLFYVILFFFIKVFGIAEWTGRLPAILSGAGTVAALYFLAREVGNIRTGILASLLLAISPFFIEFSREIHPYSLTALFAVLSWFWLIRVIKRGKSRDAILYSLASACMILTFYLGIIIVLSQLLLLIFLRLSRRKRRLIFYALLGATCLFSIWLPTFILQLMTN